MSRRLISSGVLILAPVLSANAFQLQTVRGQALSSGDPVVSAASTRNQIAREGTKVSAAAGEITQRGSRWYFTADVARSDHSVHMTVDSAEPTIPKETSDFRSRKNERKVSAGRTNAESTSLQSPSLDAASGKVSWCLCENLVLQRIAAAIHADPMDNRWSVTATFSEFDGRNYLTLLWAQRAPQLAVQMNDLEPTAELTH